MIDVIFNAQKVINLYWLKSQSNDTWEDSSTTEQLSLKHDFLWYEHQFLKDGFVGEFIRLYKYNLTVKII